MNLCWIKFNRSAAKPMKVKKIAAKPTAAAVAPSALSSLSLALSAPSRLPTACASLSLSSLSSTTSSSSSSSTLPTLAAAGAAPTKRSKAVALANKRDSHNVSERNRRHELKLSFNVLQSIVPNLVSANRAHTGTVLKETIAFINALQEQEQQLIAAKAALLAERTNLLLAC